MQRTRLRSLAEEYTVIVADGEIVNQYVAQALSLRLRITKMEPIPCHPRP